MPTPESTRMTGTTSVASARTYGARARGPLSPECLSRLPNGCLTYRMKRPAASGIGPNQHTAAVKDYWSARVRQSFGEPKSLH